jgi:serine O-acetyltransferase
LFFKNISADFRRITDLLVKKPWIVKAAYPFTVPGFHALIWYRLIQANRHYRIPILFYVFAPILRIFNTFTQWFWGICIASNSEIGPGLYIAHHGQIFVGVKTMGANCTIGHNVTIGRTEKEHGYPHVGNNVYMAPGSMIIGYITVGDNVKIGPNAVVRRNVPANSVVISPPPRVIKMTSKEEWQKEKDKISDDDYRKTDRKPASVSEDNRSQRNRSGGRRPSDSNRDGQKKPPYKKPYSQKGSSRDGLNYDSNHQHKPMQPQPGQQSQTEQRSRSEQQPQAGQQPDRNSQGSTSRGSGNYNRRGRNYREKDNRESTKQPPDKPGTDFKPEKQDTESSLKTKLPQRRVNSYPEDLDGEPLDG